MAHYHVGAQLCFTRFRGGPIGGICCVANARNASAMRWGWVCIMDFHPGVSITSVACLKTNKIKQLNNVKMKKILKEKLTY